MPHVDRGNTMLRRIRRTKYASIVVAEARSTQRDKDPNTVPSRSHRPSNAQAESMSVSSCIARDRHKPRRRVNAACWVQGLGPNRDDERTSVHIGFGERYMSALRITALCIRMLWDCIPRAQMVGGVDGQALCVLSLHESGRLP